MKTERITVAIYAGAVLVLGLIVASAPLPILLDRIVKDDAFYYFNTARIFATTGFSSFDGIHHTNGYQPLWFLVSVPVDISACGVSSFSSDFHLSNCIKPNPAATPNAA